MSLLASSLYNLIRIFSAQNRRSFLVSTCTRCFFERGVERSCKETNGETVASTCKNKKRKRESRRCHGNIAREATRGHVNPTRYETTLPNDAIRLISWKDTDVAKFFGEILTSFRRLRGVPFFYCMPVFFCTSCRDSGTWLCPLHGSLRCSLYHLFYLLHSYRCSALIQRPNVEFAHCSLKTRAL